MIEDVGLDFDEAIVFIDLSDVFDEAYLYDVDERGNVITTGLAPTDFGISTDRDMGWGEYLEALLKNNSVLIRFLVTIKKRFLEPESPWETCMRNGGIATNHRRGMWTIDDIVFREYAEKGLRRARESMDQLVDLLRRHQKRITIAVYPWPDQILHHDLNSKQVDFWQAWAEENGIALLNFFPYLIKEGTRRHNKALLLRVRRSFQRRRQPSHGRRISRGILRPGQDGLRAWCPDSLK